ncbi:hypothetical protein BBJ28_00000456 [Nothophytophthora sp. Chile5]|nr:hypothetical protein BBJ28_00000456 [Nothophytophthora sp. Chile5]
MEPSTPLLLVTLLFREKTGFASLPHVVATTSAFLDTSVELPLAKACKFGSLALLDRIWESSRQFMTADGQLEVSLWCVRKLLYMNPHYKRFQFTQSLLEAVRRQDMRMIRWLFAHFPGCLVGQSVVEAAVSAGSLEVLRFFQENERHDDAEGADEVSVDQGHVVQWVGSGDIVLVEWLLDHNGTVGVDPRPERGVHDAATNDHVAMLQWLADGGYYNQIDGVLVKAAEKEVVRWIIDRDWANEEEDRDIDSDGNAKQAGFGSLPHVVAAVSAFLDSSEEMPLAKACTFGSLALLDRIWESRRRFASGNAEVGASSWCMRSLLATDQRYQRFQFTRSLLEAVRRQDLSIVRWLFAHFPDFLVRREVVEEAAAAGSLEILRFFGENGSSEFYDGEEEDDDISMTEGRTIQWGGDDTTQAARHGHREVAMWLQQHTHALERWEHAVMFAAVANGDVLLVEWLLKRNPPWGKRRLRPQKGIHEAAANGHAHMLQWLVDRRYGDIVAGLLVKAAEKGQLDVVRWVIDRNRTLTETASDDEAFMADLGAEAILSIHFAAINGHLEVAKYLRVCVPTPLNRRQRTQQEERVIKKREELAMMFKRDAQAEIVSSKTMVQAAANGFLHVVKWLYEQFGADPEIDLFDCELSQSMGRQKDTSAMNAAARNGHLEVVRYLHELGATIKRDNLGKRKREETVEDVGYSAGLGQPDADDNTMDRQPDRPKTIPSCSRVAMDGAAANNHSDVVEWLHNNRTEGCSSDAMDLAASNSHLEMVQWLHRNRAEGCTTAAMDGAAGSGSLDLVEWLHTNRTEGCTTEAMDNAARMGHLEIVKWLHEHRSEGCTTAAMDGAACSGSLYVVKWLHANRTEGCTTKAMDLAARGGHLRVVQWLHENRSEGCTTAAMDNALLNGHFETVLSLHSARREGCTEEAVVGNYTSVDVDIKAWIFEKYPAVEAALDEAGELGAQLRVVVVTSVFLDSSVELSLDKACKVRSLALLDRIWEGSYQFANANGESGAVPWCVRKMLRTNQHYMQFQFTESLSEAIRRRKLQMVQWLFAHFPGFMVCQRVVEEAAGAGLLKISRFFLESDRRTLAGEDGDGDGDGTISMT